MSVIERSSACKENVLSAVQSLQSPILPFKEGISLKRNWKFFLNQSEFCRDGNGFLDEFKST